MLTHYHKFPIALKIPISNTELKIAFVKSQPDLPGTNELSMPNITKYSRKTGDFQQHEVINQMSQWLSILNYLTKYVPEYVTYFTLILQHCSVAILVTQGPVLLQRSDTGLDIKHLVYVPIGHMV